MKKVNALDLLQPVISGVEYGCEHRLIKQTITLQRKYIT